MSHKDDLALMAHLMRRTGFGASREELERRVAQGYEATVEELLNPPEEVEGGKMALMLRYHPSFLLPGGTPFSGQANWMYQMVSTNRPLEEKMALFWHHVFATGNSKVDNCDQLLEQIDMLRQHGLGNYKELLVELSKNPAMIFWLDNNENHRDAVNENWGRELLELFSMGVSNYTEVDVRECSRAFTGWTISPKLPRQPYGRYPWKFEYKEEDHDEGEKTFLGEVGNFNGEDIIDIVVSQPATARFISRHLYNFFVADEVQVPAWTIEPARDEEALDMMCQIFEENNYEIKPLLRMMFNSSSSRTPASPRSRVPPKSWLEPSAWWACSRTPTPASCKLAKNPPTWASPFWTRPAWKAGRPAPSGLTAAPCWPASTSWPTGSPTPTCPV